jgi:Asp-tRNA(Asn)/Glu-tRNA(Gln) amidotransferase A subunit family amidase
MHIHKKLIAGSCPLLAAALATLGISDTAEARRSAGDAPPDITPAEAPTPVKVFELEKATIKDIQSAMEEGSLTSVELVHLYLRRIQAYNQSSTISPVQPLNAILFLNPDLLEDAAQADRLRKQGIILGPLHGIPFLVKGSFPVQGLPLSGGTNAWADMVTDKDCWSVAKIRQAGGIVMGHANMDTWANSATTSSSQIRGAVRNPYLQGANPGGSSGGSGVSAGAYLTHFTFGGETGGSIRNPGDRNGLVAYKVSGGSISVNTIIPLTPERDVIGPMTRSAIDNAIVRDVAGARDPDDGWAPILPILEDKRPMPESGFVSAIQSATLKGKKIGIVGTYIGMPHPDAPTTVVGNVPVSGVSGVGTTIQVTSTQGLMIGMVVSGTGISGTTTISSVDRVNSTITVAAVITGPRTLVTYNIVGGTNTRTAQTTLANTLAVTQQAKLDMEAAGATVEYVFLPPEVDTTVLPDNPPATLSTADGNRLAAWVYRSVIEAAISRPDYTYSENAAAVLARATSVSSYISAARRNLFYTLDTSTGLYSPGDTISYADPAVVSHYERKKISKNAFEKWMDDNGLDAICWPMWPNKTRTGGTIVARDLVNAMYLPGVTVPMGRLTQAATTGANPLPAGEEPLTMDFTGRLFDDAKVLGIAYAYEQATKHRYSPTLAPPVAGEVFDFKRQSKKPYSTDKKAPVLTLAPSATRIQGNIIFRGNVADAGGIDRFEVSVAGKMLPAVVEGNTWTAIIPALDSAATFLSASSKIDVVVLAVDAAGNATSATGDVTL